MKMLINDLIGFCRDFSSLFVDTQSYTTMHLQA